ncbi:unnamed protein product, partial [Prorocentrum cordatum]
VQEALLHVRRAERAPAAAHWSFGFALDKHNGLRGLDGKRLIRLVCTFWKFFFGGLLRKPSSHECELNFDPTCHGYLAHRRREDAMMVTRCVGYALRQKGLRSVSELLDMSNAFACTPLEWLDEAVEELAEPVDWALLHDRIHHHIVEVEARGEALHFALGRGGLMGTCEAPKEFAVAFRRPVQQWRAECAAQDDLLLFKTPILELPVSCAVVQFADDLKKRHVILSGLATDAHAIIEESQTLLITELEKGGFKQNMKKREMVSELKPSENLKFKALLKPGSGKILPHARHLGGRYVWNDNASVEVGYRIDALKKGWAVMGRFWFAKSPHKLRRQLFLGKVVGAALSGMCRYVLSESELHRLDVQICKKLRVMEGGSQVAHDTHVKVLTNKQLMKRWGVVPSKAALAMQRIRWLQDMVRHPLAHQQVIAALWGHLEDEPSPIDIEGKLTVSTSPFARQFTRDLMLLEGISGTEDFFEEWALVGRAWQELWSCEEVNNAFLKVDAKLLEVSLMREDQIWKKLAPRAKESEEPEGEFVCDLTDSQGAVCGLCFDSLKKLVAHMTKARGGSHGVMCPLRCCVIANQCLNCGSL